MKIVNVPSAIQQASSAQAPGLGKNPVARAGAPIVLTSELTSITAGNGAVFPTVGLQPSFRTAYWIDEVRITVGSTVGSGGAGGPTGNNALPAALRLGFSVGQYKVCRAPVPSMMFGPLFGFDEYDNAPARTALNGTEFTNFRWPLPRPLYMPVGDILQCIVERDGTLASAVTLNNAIITYLGRMCAPGEAPPPCRYVPWVSSYQFGNASSYAEVQDEFKNPFLKDLMIQRLVARYVERGSDAADQTLMQLIGPTNVGPSANYPYAFALPNDALAWVETRISDSMGYTMVPEFTPLGVVIDATRSAWTFNRALSAREKLTVAFRRVAGLSDTQLFDTFLSMIGYREEPV